MVVIRVRNPDLRLPGQYPQVPLHPPVPPALLHRPVPPGPLRYQAQYLTPVRALVLDLDATDELDITSAEALGAVRADMRARHVRLGLAHLHAGPAGVLRDVDGDQDNVGWQAFPTLDAAVRWATGDGPPGALPVPREAHREAAKETPNG